MRAILTFKLPEESEDHNIALRAPDYYSALLSIAQVLRSARKYDTYGEVTAHMQKLLDDLKDCMPENL